MGNRAYCTHGELSISYNNIMEKNLNRKNIYTELNHSGVHLKLTYYK